MNKNNNQNNNPLSPHLQIYKLPMTAIMSISHRITGVILYLGMILLIWYFILSMNNEYSIFCNKIVTEINNILATLFARILISLWIFCFFYHMCNGIRHLIWDTGMLFSKKQVDVSGIVVIGSALILAGTTINVANLF